MSPLKKSAPPTVVFGGHTDVGKRRTNNEDSLLTVHLAVGTLLVVSDGVGGAEAGEIASRMAVEGIQHLLGERLAKEKTPADLSSWLDTSIRELDQRIRTASEQPGLSGMGATLSLLWITGRSAWWGQAGDSRIYLWRKGALKQITQDQSPVGRLRAEGKLSEEQARMHPYRNLIDQCLGGGGAEVVPVTGSMPLEPDDVFLLCSDGLSDGLWDREIAEGLQPVTNGLTPLEAARELVERAKEASGKDNITAVVARAIKVPA